jgi:hypothetical protein
MYKKIGECVKYNFSKIPQLLYVSIPTITKVFDDLKWAPIWYDLGINFKLFGFW